jgi:hypothetical protein
MPVLSVSRKLRRATACFVHWWIEQFCLDASLGGKAEFVLASTDVAADPPQTSSRFGKRERILQPVFVTTTTSSRRTPPSPG